MALHSAQFLSELNPRLIEEAHNRLPPEEARTIAPFLSRFYRQTPLEDFAEVSTIDLYGAALSHWQLGRSRPAGTRLIHVYNPDFETHGWQSTHTIIEIVCDNMPFLVDSVSMVLNRHEMTIHHTLHPVMHNRRDADGRILETLESGSGGDAVAESYMQFHVDRQSDSERLRAVERAIGEALDDVAAACTDWAAMREAVTRLSQEIGSSRSGSETDRDDAAELLSWIVDDHFTLLGYCEFAVDGSALASGAGTPLGILRREGLDAKALAAMVLPCSAETFLAKAGFLTVNKTNTRSTIHRPAYTDLIAVDLDRDGGRRICCVIGLFTSAAYNRSVRDIPYLRRKMRRLMDSSDLPERGHLEKALQNVIDTYPRDTLFQVSEDELEPILTGILHLQERQHIRLFVATEPFGRFRSCLVYVPRERFHSDLRIRIQNLLLETFEGTHIEFNVLFTESVLARIHFLVYTRPDSDVTPDIKALQTRIEEAALSWMDQLRDTLRDKFGEERGNRYFLEYRGAFSASYQYDCNARRASYDIQRMEAALEQNRLGIYFYRPVDVMDGSVRLRLYSIDSEVALSDVIPMIENMGLKVLGEKPYQVRPASHPVVWIHEFTLSGQSGQEIDVESSRDNFEQALARIWEGELENDGFNKLVLSAGLHWRESVMLRTYARYMRQIRVRYSQDYIIDTLGRNPHMTSRLVRYFHVRMDPDSAEEATVAAVREELQQGLERITNLDEDRIISGYINLIESSLRTNYYQPGADGEPKSYLSIKFDPTNIQRMPEPRPMFEIFVYSPRVEAVHLRGGKVARGGLRWSDRPEDFRTEVLGLVKAQMVKNAVIVPVGSKGGFVVKRMPQGDRKTQMVEVVNCYQTFIRGMLDITDNIVEDAIVHPPRVLRHDDDDPYLVVAADKGTATFSDIANGVAADYGFWLGDAFASGGSAGYDHKKMGITARGAWESVKRHFREMGIDTQTQPFTVIGIGDMAGDVFGNGMLLSDRIRLIGAFNHLHIFLDPDPDPARSFEERRRLFDTPGTTWEDYDRALISAGGGVFSRGAKSIALSEQTRAALGTGVERVTPNELINLMLKAPVDLIWNGGIGTYVKSSAESHEQVRDRANDSLRVDGSELRCKAFGEGGNLGMTQLGRIEYNRRGGLCYTDSIDNSAGVDTSDHEVNIKILLDRAVAGGDLTGKQRNELLESMTDEVAELVLRDNYMQTQAISLAEVHGPALMRQHMRFIRALEKDGLLNRGLEFLPDDDTAAERMQANQGLCRAEMSVLLAYSKLILNDRLIHSDVPEDPFLSTTLKHYFPRRLCDTFPALMREHRLRREIIITHIVNEMVNRGGPTFAFRLQELTGASYPHLARAYAVATEVFGLRSLYAQIEALDNKVADSVQKSMLSDLIGLLERATSWLVRNRPEEMNISEVVDHFKVGTESLIASYPRSMAASNRLHQKKRSQRLIGAGVPRELALQISYAVPMSSSFDIIEIAEADGFDIAHAAGIYYGIGDRLELHWLRERISALPIRNHWQAMAAFSLRNELHQQQKALAGLVISSTRSGGRGRGALNRWIHANAAACDRFLQLIGDFKASREIDFAMLSVAISQVKALQSTPG